MSKHLEDTPQPVSPADQFLRRKVDGPDASTPVISPGKPTPPKWPA